MFKDTKCKSAHMGIRDISVQKIFLEVLRAYARS